MNLTPTEQEELRIAIAEEIGIVATVCTCGKAKDRARDKHVPPYTTSIDAIQAAALERFKKGTEVSEFSMRLEWRMKFEHHDNPLAFAFWQLTSLDWCIAFARTAKIWRWK